MENEAFEDQIETQNMRPKKQNLERIFPLQLRYAPRKGILFINAPINGLQDLSKQNHIGNLNVYRNCPGKMFYFFYDNFPNFEATKARTEHVKRFKLYEV